MNVESVISALLANRLLLAALVAAAGTAIGLVGVRRRQGLPDDRGYRLWFGWMTLCAVTTAALCIAVIREADARTARTGSTTAATTVEQVQDFLTRYHDPAGAPSEDHLGEYWGFPATYYGKRGIADAAALHRAVERPAKGCELTNRRVEKIEPRRGQLLVTETVDWRNRVASGRVAVMVTLDSADDPPGFRIRAMEEPPYRQQQACPAR